MTGASCATCSIARGTSAARERSSAAPLDRCAAQEDGGRPRCVRDVAFVIVQALLASSRVVVQARGATQRRERVERRGR